MFDLASIRLMFILYVGQLFIWDATTNFHEFMKVIKYAGVFFPPCRENVTPLCVGCVSICSQRKQEFLNKYAAPVCLL